jgi:protoporphyrinogen/coproporphyrinogen III oxidase
MPRHIAILGGGISGLSAAFHLSRLHKDLLVTLIERKSQLGGWIQGHRSPEGVLIEHGPRSLRKSNAILELVSILCMSLKEQLTDMISSDKPP